MLLPIYMEMKRVGSVNIELIFLDDLAFRQLKRDDFLFRQVSECVDKISLLPKNKIKTCSNPAVKFFHLLLFILKLLGILYRITITKKPVMMHCGRVSDPFLGVLYRAIKRKKGFTVAHFKLMDLFVNDDKKQLYVQDDFGDIFICFNKKNILSWDKSSKNKCIEIGYPRLYESWLNNLRKNSKYYVQKHIKETAAQLMSMAVLFLPSTVKGVFEEEELKEWILEVVYCLSEQFDDALIVLKPHPMQNFKHLDSILNELNNKRCTVSFLHPGILAAEAKLVVSHHSSTIVDALALDTPVIQHQNFTAHWLERHPEGSSFLELGHSWTKNVDDLALELKRIKNNEWIPPNFLRYIGHKNSIKNLFKKIELR
jgi:hypothetical protein